MSHLLPDDISLYRRWLFNVLMLGGRYLIFAGTLYLIYYVIKRKDWFYAKIQQKYPERKQILTEVKYSVLSFFVFATVLVLMRMASMYGILTSQVYHKFSDHSVAYFTGTTIFIIFFHDTYFYWAHRLMHHPLLYERVHKAHHLSKDPTPWASFAFHPIEAVLEIGFVPILIFTIPLHISSLFFLSMWQISFNVMGHLGYEIFPRKMMQNPVFKWMNTSTNHNMHHKFVKCNYGLYFNIWDILMNTNHAKYYATFDEVTARRDAGQKTVSESQDFVPELELETTGANS
jgi:sterol desaturase/sphingolipid hydroxylase (fatty acid hydroxylase superfamily)